MIVWVFGVMIILRLFGKDIGVYFVVYEDVIMFGLGFLIYYYICEDEYWYVVEGKMKWIRGDEVFYVIKGFII